MTTKLKTSKLQDLQSRIKGLAADGRAKRAEAQTLTHLDRHQAKCEANWIGSDARDHLLAYALLRGRDLAKCESPRTRTPFDVSAVMSIIEAYYTPREGVDTETFLDECRSKLHAWNKAAYTNNRENPGLALKEAA